jgi:hypothetical protein
MSKAEQAANDLIEQHSIFSMNWDCFNDCPDEGQNDLKAALRDNQNTIDALDKLNRKNLGRNMGVRLEYDFHKAVQTILKSKLK